MDNKDVREEIFPRALMIAARTFSNKPKVVGEILVALVKGKDSSGTARGITTSGESRTGLSEVQEYILAECREEIAERVAKREEWRKRKQASRRLADSSARAGKKKEGK